MATGFVFEGLEQLKADLRNLPAALKGEATGIVTNHGTRAKSTMAAVYASHTKSGNIAKHLHLTVLAIGPHGVAVELRNNAYHSWLFDNGSVARHYTGTDKRGRVFADADRGRMWGKTPPTHVFARTMAQTRRAVTLALADLLRRHGLTAVE